MKVGNLDLEIDNHYFSLYTDKGYTAYKSAYEDIYWIIRHDIKRVAYLYADEINLKGRCIQRREQVSFNMYDNEMKNYLPLYQKALNKFQKYISLV